MNSVRLLDDSACCLTVTVKEAAAILGVGRNTAYEAIKRNEVPSVHSGGFV